jgi:hypothetical protein
MTSAKACRLRPRQSGRDAAVHENAAIFSVWHCCDFAATNRTKSSERGRVDGISNDANVTVQIDEVSDPHVRAAELALFRIGGAADQAILSPGKDGPRLVARNKRSIAADIIFHTGGCSSRNGWNVPFADC